MDSNTSSGSEFTAFNMIGLFSDAPELLDQITEEAYQNRERDPLRLESEQTERFSTRPV